MIDMEASFSDLAAHSMAFEHEDKQDLLHALADLFDEEGIPTSLLESFVTELEESRQQYGTIRPPADGKPCISSYRAKAKQSLSADEWLKEELLGSSLLETFPALLPKICGLVGSPQTASPGRETLPSVGSLGRRPDNIRVSSVRHLDSSSDDSSLARPTFNRSSSLKFERKSPSEKLLNPGALYSPLKAPVRDTPKGQYRSITPVKERRVVKESDCNILSSPVKVMRQRVSSRSLGLNSPRRRVRKLEVSSQRASDDPPILLLTELGNEKTKTTKPRTHKTSSHRSSDDPPVLLLTELEETKSAKPRRVPRAKSGENELNTSRSSTKSKKLRKHDSFDSSDDGRAELNDSKPMVKSRSFRKKQSFSSSDEMEESLRSKKSLSPRKKRASLNDERARDLTTIRRSLISRKKNSSAKERSELDTSRKSLNSGSELETSRSKSPRKKGSVSTSDRKSSRKEKRPSCKDIRPSLEASSDHQSFGSPSSKDRRPSLKASSDHQSFRSPFSEDSRPSLRALSDHQSFRSPSSLDAARPRLNKVFSSERDLRRSKGSRSVVGSLEASPARHSVHGRKNRASWAGYQDTGVYSSDDDESSLGSLVDASSDDGSPKQPSIKSGTHQRRKPSRTSSNDGSVCTDSSDSPVKRSSRSKAGRDKTSSRELKSPVKRNSRKSCSDENDTRTERRKSREKRDRREPLATGKPKRQYERSASYRSLTKTKETLSRDGRKERLVKSPAKSSRSVLKV